MKTIGLIGGMSWEASAEYYRIINEEVRKRLQREEGWEATQEGYHFIGAVRPRNMTNPLVIRMIPTAVRPHVR